MHATPREQRDRRATATTAVRLRVLNSAVGLVRVMSRRAAMIATTVRELPSSRRRLAGGRDLSPMGTSCTVDRCEGL